MAGEMEQPVAGSGFNWRDYLTPVVGLIVIIAIVIGIFSAVRSLTSRKTQQVATESQVNEESTVPTSEIDLGTATDTNSQAPQAMSTPAAELPKTGFPGEIVAALSALLAGVGFKLRKFAKRLQ
ncbi:MAG: hypothetical protein Q7S79_02860 [bacterium]|nr:hypothetical protein [bacterium]